MPRRDPHRQAAELVRDAGGELVGRTRLQKVAYLTQLAGFGDHFSFEYRHYGPFSEELASAMEIASGLGLVNEEERRTDWGGWYSIYSVVQGAASSEDQQRATFVSAAAQIGSIELELAATAAFLYAHEGIGKSVSGDPWEETARRKPQKAADGRLEKAKAAYRNLLTMSVPNPLPSIA
jgi:uncharacterized protein